VLNQLGDIWEPIIHHIEDRLFRALLCNTSILFSATNRSSRRGTM
jgi:hypothetical protein